MRILAGTCTRQSPAVLRAHLQTMQWQRTDAQVDLCYVDDNTDTASTDALMEVNARLLDAGERPEGAMYAVDEQTHRWSLPTFQWLGTQKDRLIALAAEEGYDALWLVDSDLLCAPTALASLMSCQKQVASAVFWTRWQPDASMLPQVWLQHPYGFRGRGMQEHEFLRMLSRDTPLVPVEGLGACTLIRASAFDKVSFMPPIEHLPSEGMWQGEDRHFSIRAKRNHVELWADAWPLIWHCYRPSDVEHIPARLEALAAPTPTASALGMQISATIEPMEEKRLPMHIEHVRGRLGAIPLVPTLEGALSRMRVGDDHLLHIPFPPWYEFEEYRGQTKLMRVKLLDARMPTIPPGLDETAHG